MRILIWTDAFWPEIGGLEVFCMRLGTELQHRGHQCQVVTGRNEGLGPEFASYRGIPVHRFNFEMALKSRDLSAIRMNVEGCNRVIEKFRPDLIHLNAHLRSIFYFLRVQKNERLPALLTFHDNYLFRQTAEVAPVVMENVDAAVAISDSIRKDALAFDARIEAKLHTILNALPQPDVLPKPLPQVPRILAFGRLVADKGFDLAIQAFVSVAADFPSASLTIAGDGPELRNLEALAETSGFGDRIHFPGFVSPDKIPELINEHSLVIVPSRWKEPFGLVALDAALMGRPVVASKTGGLPEIVEDGVTGKLFENENLPALTAALRSFLESPELGGKLGRQARTHALTRFDYDRFVTAYESLFVKVVDGKVRLAGSS